MNDIKINLVKLNWIKVKWIVRYDDDDTENQLIEGMRFVCLFVHASE